MCRSIFQPGIIFLQHKHFLLTFPVVQIPSDEFFPSFFDWKSTYFTVFWKICYWILKSRLTVFVCLFFKSFSTLKMTSNLHCFWWQIRAVTLMLGSSVWNMLFVPDCFEVFLFINGLINLIRMYYLGVILFMFLVLGVH